MDELDDPNWVFFPSEFFRVAESVSEQLLQLP